MNQELKYIDESHGMELYEDLEPNKRQNENGILFYTQYLILKNIAGMLSVEDIMRFQIVVENITSFDKDGNKIKGLYDRGAGDSLKIDKDSIRTISHDNITAISAFSRSLESEGLTYHKDIAQHGRRALWRFDNVYPEKPRWSRLMLPRDIIFWSRNNNSLIGRAMIWWVVLSCIFSCIKKYDYRPMWYSRLWQLIKTGKLPSRNKNYATSGKLLTFVRLYCLRRTFVGKLGWRICTFLVNRHWDEGWKFVFDYYYKNPNHPIRFLVKEIYSKNRRMF